MKTICVVGSSLLPALYAAYSAVVAPRRLASGPF